MHLQLGRDLLEHAPRPQSCFTRIARFTRVARLKFSPIRELLRLICEQLLLRCRVALVLNEDLIDTL